MALPSRITPPSWVTNSKSINKALSIFSVDFNPCPDQPTGQALSVATVVSIVGSLVADALVVAIGTRIFPSTRGYVHFRFMDYAALTIVGVLIACVAWPVVTRISSAPRWLFMRLAVLVTVALWVPDVWLLVRGEPAKAVFVLMVMHVAIALVTYNALVRIAAVRGRSGRSGDLYDGENLQFKLPAPR